jgi:transposase
MKRLFCTGDGPDFRYGMFPSKADAAASFNSPARTPDSDDIRRVWQENKLHEKTPEEIRALFGITRQALSLWRIKAGVDLPNYRQHTNDQAKAKVREVFDPTWTAAALAELTGTTIKIVKEVAAERGVNLPKGSEKKPSDDEIIRLADGKNWRELAKACNVAVATLQHYVYAKPELAQALRARMDREQTGAPSHGSMYDVDKMLELYQSGSSAYQIAQHFEVQPMTIIYWLKKLGIYRGAA